MEAPRFDDYSANFSALRKTLVDNQGLAYSDFVKALRPDYRRVRRDVTTGYIAIGATALIVAFLPLAGIPPLIVAALGAVSIGYWLAYLQLFIHEGAHFNLAPTREESDRFCDRWISWLVGTNVADYRIFHFQHHRALGTVDDSEHSYFFPLNLIFFAKTLLGLRVAEVISERRSRAQKRTEKRPSSPRGAMLAPVAHGAIVVVAFLAGAWWLALAWLVGVGAVFPFLAALRQLLEHRDENADAKTDYRKTDHGAVTRIFPDGAFSSTFGGAGFNRHLLHHWEPQVSYTNLPQLERYLMDTHLKSTIDGRRTTYAAAFLKLLSI